MVFPSENLLNSPSYQRLSRPGPRRAVSRPFGYVDVNPTRTRTLFGLFPNFLLENYFGRFVLLSSKLATSPRSSRLPPRTKKRDSTQSSPGKSHKTRRVHEGPRGVSSHPLGQTAATRRHGTDVMASADPGASARRSDPPGVSGSSKWTVQRV